MTDKQKIAKGLAFVMVLFLLTAGAKALANWIGFETTVLFFFILLVMITARRK